MYIWGKITIHERAERQQAAILIGRELSAERIQNGTVGTGKVPSLVVADISIGKDIARLVFFRIRMTVDGKPKVNAHAYKQA
jgi:hypothetical protein